MNNKYDLADRLINFASEIIDVTERLPRTFAGNHLGSQLLRSGTSPALHYGEAQSAESRSDFHTQNESVPEGIKGKLQLSSADSLQILVAKRHN